MAKILRAVFAVNVEISWLSFNVYVVEVRAAAKFRLH